MAIKTFHYEGANWIKIIPSKTLFRSNMIHEVTTRGSIFALNLDTGIFTVLPGSTILSDGSRQYHLFETQSSFDARAERAAKAQEARKKLAELSAQIKQLEKELT